MPNSVAVLVGVTDDLVLTELVGGLDTQTLPTSEFHVTLLVSESSGPTIERLQSLAARRPNVVVETHAGSTEQALNEARKQVSDGWVLLLSAAVDGPTARLQPPALSDLMHFGELHHLDLVIGRHRPVDDSQPIAALLTADATELDHDVVPPIADAPLRLLRAGVDTPVRIGVLGSSCGLTGVAARSEAAPGAPAVHDAPVSAAWTAGRLLVRLELGEHASAIGRLTASLGHQDGAELPLSAEPESASTVVIDVDLTDPDLAPGVWTIFLNAYAPDGTALWRRLCPAAAVSTAVIGGRFVVPFGGKRGFSLDVGATRRPVLGRISPRRVSLTESVRGNLLSVELDRLYADRPARLIGSVELGGFPLPAELIADPNGVRLECWVSGLPGRSEVATRFGSGRAAPTGLTLRISNQGRLKVVRTAASSTPPASAAGRSTERPAGSESPARPVSMRLTRALRRRLRRFGPARRLRDLLRS